MGASSSGRLFRHYQIRILVATWLAYAGYYFCRKAFYVVKKDVADTFALSSVELAHLGTAYLVGYAMGQFSSAWLGRRLGPKLLLLVGMGISLICNLVFGANNGFWTMLLFMALNGMAQGTGWPGCIGSLSSWFRREQRGSVLGLWSTCYQLGSVAAGASAAFLLGLAGWRWSFFGASLVLLAVWAIVLWLHPNTPEHVGLCSIRDDDAPAPAEVGASTAREGLGWDRRVIVSVLLMGAVYFCIKFLRYALWSWTPLFLRENFGLEGDQAGYLSTLFDLTGFLGVIAAGFLSDRLFRGRRSFVALAMLLGMTVSFGAMLLWGAHSLVLFAVTLGGCGFLLYGPDSLLSGVGAIDVGGVRGALTAAGIINGMGSIGPIFQEQLVGWMYKFFDRDLVPVLIVLLAVAASGTTIALALHRLARRGQSAI